MSGVQDLIGGFNAVARGERSRYHVTLGELIEFLKTLVKRNRDDLPVVYNDDNEPPGVPDSYRGDYADLAFADGDGPVTVREFFEVCESALDQEFTGYKGGQYKMGADTPLWRAEYGRTGSAILTVHEEDDCVVLTTKEV